MFVAAAVADCEMVHAGWPDQPVNAWSSLAFVIAGAAILIRSRNTAARMVGLGAALVGLGSFLFHGDQSGFSGWVHDWSIALLLVVLIAYAGETAIRTLPILLALAGLAVFLAVVPDFNEWIHAGLAAGLGAVELRAWALRRRSGQWPVVALFSTGAVLTILGRTGGPWCEPGATLQPHAAWHVLVAAAIVAYAGSRDWLDRRAATTG